MDEAAVEPLRFVALDVHTHYVMVGAVDVRQSIVLTPRRVGLPDFPDWARAHLTATDAVVLEASAHAWRLYDVLEPFAASVTVAHAGAIKAIAQARVKTDARDTIQLARLRAARLIPAVWVPPRAVRAVRALRGLVLHRRRLVSQRSQARHRLQAVLQRHQIVPPAATGRHRLASSSGESTVPGGRASPSRRWNSCACGRTWPCWRRLSP